MTQARRRGRPARISWQDIAKSALVIGLDEVTLPAIAEHLGVDHSSLYRHIGGREDMLLAAANLAIAELDWEIETDDWREYLIVMSEAVWDLYARYPGLAETMRTLSETPPAGAQAFGRACQALEKFGFSAQDTVLIVDSIMDMTSDSASGWQRLGTPAQDGTVPKDKLRRSWQDATDYDGHTTEQFRIVANIITGDPKEWWRRKLNILLDGTSTRRNSQ
ncbi:MAG: helix-turn-helix domain-containing protein [Pseudomonadota bacterium]